MSDLVERLRDGRNWLNSGNCCGDKDSEGICAAPACIFGEALKEFFEAADEIERLRARLAEANELAGLGCDANNGGAHSIVKVKNYSFCHKCGETMRDIPMRERARIAEARLADVERERDALIQTTEANFRQWGAATAQAERLEAALRRLITHTLDCEERLDELHGLGKDAGSGMSSVVCEARAALEEEK